MKRTRRKPSRMRTKAERLAQGDRGPLGWAEAKEKRWARRTLMRKQVGLCALCGVQMCLLAGDPTCATLDHVVPRSRGGTDAITNLQLACSRCNQAKGDEMPEKSELKVRGGGAL